MEESVFKFSAALPCRKEMLSISDGKDCNWLNLSHEKAAAAGSFCPAVKDVPRSLPKSRKVLIIASCGRDDVSALAWLDIISLICSNFSRCSGVNFDWSVPLSKGFSEGA